MHDKLLGGVVVFLNINSPITKSFSSIELESHEWDKTNGLSTRFDDGELPPTTQSNWYTCIGITMVSIRPSTSTYINQHLQYTFGTISIRFQRVGNESTKKAPLVIKNNSGDNDNV